MVMRIFKLSKLALHNCIAVTFHCKQLPINALEEMKECDGR